MRRRLLAIAAVLSLGVGALGCAASDLGTTPEPLQQPGAISVVRPLANQESHCTSWMTYLQCYHYSNALSDLYTVCPDVFSYVTGSSYIVNYDGLDYENYGYSYSNQPHAMWLTYAAFNDPGELSNTIAHEYGHNIGLNETDATSLGKSCGGQN